jgi:hypothetical protein
MIFHIEAHECVKLLGALSDSKDVFVACPFIEIEAELGQLQADVPVEICIAQFVHRGNDLVGRGACLFEFACGLPEVVDRRKKALCTKASAYSGHLGLRSPGDEATDDPRELGLSLNEVR